MHRTDHGERLACLVQPQRRDPCARSRPLSARGLRPATSPAPPARASSTKRAARRAHRSAMDRPAQAHRSRSRRGTCSRPGHVAAAIRPEPALKSKISDATSPTWQRRPSSRVSGRGRFDTRASCQATRGSNQFDKVPARRLTSKGETLRRGARSVKSPIWPLGRRIGAPRLRLRVSRRSRNNPGPVRRRFRQDPEAAATPNAGRVRGVERALEAPSGVTGGRSR